MLENLVCAPEEHIVLKALLAKSCALNQVHYGRLHAGEKDHSSL